MAQARAGIGRYFGFYNDERAHQALGYLNSSTSCFYCRQVLHSKGAQGVNEGHKAEEWEQFLEFSGTQIAGVPLPPNWESLAPLAREMESLAAARARASPPALVAHAGTGASLRDSEVAEARQREAKITRQMVGVQERIDFEVYRLFGLTASVPPAAAEITPGARPFEVQLVRDAMNRCLAGEGPVHPRG